MKVPLHNTLITLSVNFMEKDPLELTGLFCLSCSGPLVLETEVEKKETKTKNTERTLLRCSRCRKSVKKALMDKTYAHLL